MELCGHFKSISWNELLLLLVCVFAVSPNYVFFANNTDYRGMQNSIYKLTSRYIDGFRDELTSKRKCLVQHVQLPFSFYSTKDCEY